MIPSNDRWESGETMSLCAAGFQDYHDWVIKETGDVS